MEKTYLSSGEGIPPSQIFLVDPAVRFPAKKQ